MKYLKSQKHPKREFCIRKLTKTFPSTRYSLKNYLQHLISRRLISVYGLHNIPAESRKLCSKHSQMKLDTLYAYAFTVIFFVVVPLLMFLFFLLKICGSVNLTSNNGN
jgi:hypothetical protein